MQTGNNPPSLDSLIGLPGRLTDAEFRRVSELVYRSSGISLKEGKQDLVKARLGRRLRILGLPTFMAYFDHVEADRAGTELAEMLDLITTNKTQFFRDSQHFDFMRARLSEGWAAQGRVRFWSAGCSTGEEPYSLAMMLSEVFPDLERRDLKILATDICRPVLEQAESGIYEAGDVGDIPTALLTRHFSQTEGGCWKVKDRLRRLIVFGRLNLMGKWPMKGPFQAILCRNVMIYFDRPTREDLINRYWNLLEDGGYFFVGFSESLTGLKHRFKYVQPAVYCKSL